MPIRIAQRLPNPKIATGQSFYLWRERIAPNRLFLIPKFIRDRHKKIALKANELTPDIFRQLLAHGGPGHYRIFSDSKFAWFSRGKIFCGFINETVVLQAQAMAAQGYDFLTIAKNIEGEQSQTKDDKTKERMID